MRIFRSIESFPSVSSLYLTLGYFDGVHLGHQKILTRLVEDAKKAGIPSAVFTFREHPQRILNPESDKFLLMSNEQKLCFFERMSIDFCFLIPFTLEFSRQEAESFVEDILIKKLKTKKIFLGYNAHFGRQRKGNVGLMKELAPKLNFQFEEIPPMIIDAQPVSSSRIRELIKSGQMEMVESCLGRPFSVFGKVVKGSGRGTGLGYPTANLEIDSELLPPEGVYPVLARAVECHESGTGELRVNSSGQAYRGVMNYGRRPTFGQTDSKPRMEVFLIDFAGDLYGKTLEVSFFSQIRGEKKFENAEILRRQIEMDVEFAKKYFQSHK